VRKIPHAEREVYDCGNIGKDAVDYFNANRLFSRKSGQIPRQWVKAPLRPARFGLGVGPGIDPMSLSTLKFRHFILLGAAFALIGAESASAGWMGFRNDTKDTIVLQETIIVGGQAKQAKPQRLFTGEAVKETQWTGVQRKISIFDTKNPNTPLHTANFPCPAANENFLYAIKSDGKGGITIETIKTPATPAKK
jgi:hypothetical protein